MDQISWHHPPDIIQTAGKPALLGFATLRNIVMLGAKLQAESATISANIDRLKQ